MKTFGSAIENIFMVLIGLILVTAWLAGFAYAKSAWCIIPLYSWYVVLEKAMAYYSIFGYIS